MRSPLLGAFLASTMMLACGSGQTAERRTPASGPAAEDAANAETVPSESEQAGVETDQSESGSVQDGAELGGDQAGSVASPTQADTAPVQTTPVVDSPTSTTGATLASTAHEGDSLDTTAEGAEASTATVIESTPTSTAGLRPEWPTFIEGSAPAWPFRGLVQLWHGPYEAEQGPQQSGWMLRYWSWDPSARGHSQVLLRGFEIDCLGQVALVVHGEHGVEVGGAPAAASGAYWVDWAGDARLVVPSDVLLEAVGLRPSNVVVNTDGDLVHVGIDSQQQSYAMRDPVRSDGQRWVVEARHDGDLFLITVHPAHLPCYSGVSWLSVAESGEFVICGANTAATAYVSPSEPSAEDLVLPSPETMGTYLSCAPRLDMSKLPFTIERELVPG